MTPAASRRVGESPFWLVFPMGLAATVVPGLNLGADDAAVLDERVGFVGIIRKGRPRLFDARKWPEFYAACEAAQKDEERAEALMAKVNAAAARLDAEHRDPTFVLALEALRDQQIAEEAAKEAAEDAEAANG